MMGRRRWKGASKDGRVVEGQMVIVSAGVRPNLQLAKAMGWRSKMESRSMIDWKQIKKGFCSGRCCRTSRSLLWDLAGSSKARGGSRS